MNNNIVLYPGSFDPITKGHQSIALRAAQMFDNVIVAIGNNPDKKSMFPIEQRLRFVEATFQGVPNIKVLSYNCLTVDLCRKENIRYIIRGIRSGMDWNAETAIANANKLLFPPLETLFLLTEPHFVGISSSVVREILTYGGDVSAFVPQQIVNML
ncbi:MAG: pantetheine-phosphate adenylyltransferase [Bacteroidales bacterium]|jgi:pantetheine-phosphate adenylyltransferase|nr:pantetheine-phosphate adenylyltransferase [Bacteroidales bacterium]